MPECCEDLDRIMEDGAIVRSERGTISDGRILNDIFSDYYLRIRSESSGYRYYALNFCPFCGRALALRL